MADADAPRTGPITDATVPAREAATIVLLRDGADGVEVLMQQRHLETDFVGGALVFPGGAVDPGDATLPDDLVADADIPRVAAAFRSEPGAARAILVAAAREAFEEAGVMLAVDAAGDEVVPEQLDETDIVAAREALASRDKSQGDLPGLLTSRGWRLSLSALRPYAWWVTPDGLHRRYDTKFFVTSVPTGQDRTASADEVEVVNARWLRPSDALAMEADGSATVIFPTRRVLADLAEHDDVASVLARVDGSSTTIERLQPRIVTIDGQVMVTLDDGTPPEAP